LKKKVYSVPRWLAVATLLLIVLLSLVLWSKLRSPNVHLRVTEGSIRQLLPSISGIARGQLLGGNKVEVLQNGAFFDALLKDIDGAKETVNFESFIWWKSDISEQLTTHFLAAAKRGVRVKVLLDGSGSRKGDKKQFERMEAAGIEVEKFHPHRISNIGRINNRDHRKIVVIDGRIGYAGGHGVGDEWTGNAEDKDHWRDTFLRIEGPVVAQLQGAFFENWIQETGRVPAGLQYFPRLGPAGSSVAHVAYSSPSPNVAPVRLLYYLAIAAAQKEIIIQNPYFLPDTDAIDALEEAAKRGVKIHVMLPSVNVNDSPIVQHASHHHYGTLLKRGLRIYEYDKTLLHQKVMIIDGSWSTVGSTNFDDRSFEINDEISVGIYDPGIAAVLRGAFLDDMKHAREMKLDTWKDRSWWHKLKDGAAFSMNEQL
jgi:cardiolipin synthase A/B